MKGVARVISIGVGNSTDEMELRDVIATSPEDYIRVENFEQLSLRLDRLIAAVSDALDKLACSHIAVVSDVLDNRLTCSG